MFACFILIWSVQAEVGHTLKSLKCYECQTRKGFGPFSICPEPEEFQDTAPLIECNHKRGVSFCVKSEGGKKIYFCLSLGSVWTYYFVQKTDHFMDVEGTMVPVLKNLETTGKDFLMNSLKWMEDVSELLVQSLIHIVFVTRMVAMHLKFIQTSLSH